MNLSVEDLRLERRYVVDSWEEMGLDGRLFLKETGRVRGVLLWFASAALLQAGGVTVITHGNSGNVDHWVIPMAELATDYPGFPGATSSCAVLVISKSGGLATATWLGGVEPNLSDSGELFVKLDWSAISGFFQASTGEVAQAAVTAMMDASLITETGGHPLVGLPLHLIGHSRGASVVTEMARMFGEEGIWVGRRRG
jgi:pimeloyl-ACP methyl ester carboxylesterase